jgi:LDH2 family malate/lactate/ureidoglycolate dehydrogenase
MKVAVETLKGTCFEIVKRSGYTPEEARIITDILMYAQLRGNNQGAIKLTGAGIPKNPAAYPIKILHETKLSALLDGGHNMGMIAVNRAVDIAVQKAQEHGVGIVGTNNTNSSTGAIGYYVNSIARAGLIGFAFAGSGEYVAMYGAYEPILGTNPLAVGIPSVGTPIVFDMATSAIARFGIVEAKVAGRSIPPDVAYDSEGHPTTDPGAALAGAIRTFGGYKGAGLAFIVEVLTHTLMGTTLSPDGHKTDWANLIMAIDPALLGDRESFQVRVAELVQRVKATHKLPDTEEILVPGERGNRILAEAEKTGLIEIEDQLWAALLKLAA